MRYTHPKPDAIQAAAMKAGELLTPGKKQRGDVVRFVKGKSGKSLNSSWRMLYVGSTGKEAIGNSPPVKKGRVTVAGHPTHDPAPGTLNSIFKQARTKRES